MRSSVLVRGVLAGIIGLGAWQARGLSSAQSAVSVVTGSVAVRGQGATAPDRSDIVIWLSPAAPATTARPRQAAPRRFRIEQQNKRFQPHVLVVPVGSFVDFPNLDPIFHNVFSLFDGRRFDLGLYEAGTSRGVSFTRAGVCYVFCNIHPEMSAVVVVVDSPFYAVTGAAGTFTIADVPPGRYTVSAWHERYKPEDAAALPREVTIAGPNAVLGAFRFVEASRVPAPHKNKFGQDYVPPPAVTPLYP